MLGQSPIPTSSTCTDAQTSILQMDSVFQSLSAEMQSRFQSAHDTIMASYQSQWSDTLTYIPFECALTSLYALGIQADGLTAQMQSAAGQVPVGVGGPASGSHQSLLPGLLGTQSTAVLVIGVLVVGYLLLRK
jgi:hypothetical protein